VLKIEIKRVFDDEKGRPGAARIARRLQDEGKPAGLHRIARIMKDNGWRAKAARKDMFSCLPGAVQKTSTELQHEQERPLL